MGFSLKSILRKGDDTTVVQSTAYESNADASEDVANADVHLRRMKAQHKWDPFMDYDKIDAVDAALATGDVEKEAAVEESILQEDSPYLEVRSAVGRTRALSVSCSDI